MLTPNRSKWQRYVSLCNRELTTRQISSSSNLIKLSTLNSSPISNSWLKRASYLSSYNNKRPRLQIWTLMVEIIHKWQRVKSYKWDRNKKRQTRRSRCSRHLLTELIFRLREPRPFTIQRHWLMNLRLHRIIHIHKCPRIFSCITLWLQGHPPLQQDPKLIKLLSQTRSLYNS